MTEMSALMAPLVPGLLFVALGLVRVQSMKDGEPSNWVFGLAVVGVAVPYSVLSCFVIVGGPDARFLKADTLIIATITGALAVTLGYVASRLFRIDWHHALLMIIPTILEFIFTFVLVRLGTKILPSWLMWGILILPAIFAATFGVIGFRRRNAKLPRGGTLTSGCT